MLQQTTHIFPSSLWRDERAQAFAEYALLLALVAVAATAALTPISGFVLHTFTTIAAALHR